MATKPKLKSSPKQGRPSQGGRKAYRARRKAEHDMARLAQAQYEQLIQLRETSAQKGCLSHE